MIVPSLLLLVWFALLIKWSDIFVDGASGLAKKYKLSEMFIWLTIVAFGTSAPELIVNIQSAFQGYTDLSLWNIIWTNIANIALILGTWLILWTFTVAKKVNKDILFSLFFAFLFFALLIIGNWAPSYLSTLFLWLLLLIAFGYYFWYTYTHSSADDIEIDPVVSKELWILILMIIWGLGAIILGWNFVVDNAIKIAESFGVSSRIIGLTIVALGTSLPELMTTIVSIRKWHHAMGIGNIIGSNIFNIGLIGWVTSLIHPIVFESGSYYDFIVLFVITGLLFFFIKHNKAHMKKWQWIVFIAIYVLYMVSLVL